jgi:Ca2+-binding EF-hand superfamily protein
VSDTPNTTTFENKIGILSQLWLDYNGDEEFADFFDYNDLGLPLAYLLENEVVKINTEMGNRLIDETFALLLAGLELEDTGYLTLEDVLDLNNE